MVCTAGILGDEGHVEFDQGSRDEKEIDCLHEDKEEEVRVVAPAHAIVKPLAMVVKSVNAPVTDVAVAADSIQTNKIVQIVLFSHCSPGSTICGKIRVCKENWATNIATKNPIIVLRDLLILCTGVSSTNTPLMRCHKLLSYSMVSDKS